MAGINETLGRLQNAWLNMAFSQKVIIGGIGAAVIISLIVFSMWLNKPNYAVLFSDLDVKSAGEVASQLEKMGENYRVDRGGTAVLVSADRVSKLRINLASSGVISSGGVGYEIFDSNDLGATDFVQRLNLKRALEGELSRTISDITVVDKARVHIVFSKESIFKDKGREATASVILNLSRGRSLDQAQVMGIANLVSYGVEGMEAENVTIIDQDGRTLTGNMKEDVPGANSARLSIKKQFEDYLAGKAEKMLMTVIGPGRAVVRINADLDFREVKSTRDRKSVV